MSDVTIQRARTRQPSHLDGAKGDDLLGGRLGLDVPRETWPTAPELKRLEACGYSWVQLHTPPVEMLADPVCVERHADCLRAVLAPTSLSLVLHAPDTLSVGSELHDRAFAGLLDCAVAVGARTVVYHAGRFPVAAGAAADRVEDRLLAEERSLRRFAERAAAAGIVIALENLAPVYPVPPARHELSHAPLFVHDLVKRIGSPAVGMAFDVGHAHITSQLDGVALVDVLAHVADAVVLFHVHDNLGVRRGPGTPPGILPLRLDLHMAPGRGSVPWRVLAPLLRIHQAPLLMEIAPGQRPEPLRLATVSAELLTRI
ncbi:MAG TPA: sugar phosphate isomerase/epimerase [Conexibacter sp.]|jgi:sugar phosphate isomerase/epimerase